MIQVRNMHQLKFDRINQTIDLFHQLPHATNRNKIPLDSITNISNPIYTFITKMSLPNLAQWEIDRVSIFDGPGYGEWFKQFQQIVESGTSELYTIEGEHAGWDKPGSLVVREVYRALKWQIRPAVALLQRYG